MKLVHLKQYLKNKATADSIEAAAHQYEPLAQLMQEVFTKKLDKVDSISIDSNNWAVKRAFADGKMQAYKEVLTIFNVEE